MGESIVAASSYEDKIGGTAASDPALQVSVSFGRFENDSLSWEKWSSFSQNKYLEEVEKCASPGSVAEKKAYFEAHYKKIAARKAELFDQEKQMEHESSMENNHNIGDLTGKNGQTDSSFDVSNGQTSAEGIWHESKLDNERDGGHVDEPYEDAAIDVHGQASLSGLYEDAANDVQSQASSNGRVKEELENKLDSPESTKLEELALIKEEEKGYQDTRELPKNSEKEKESILMIKEEKVKFDHQRGSSKIIPLSKVRDIARAKKKPEPLVTKQPQISTPKVSKRVPTSSSLSASQSSTKKMNGSLLPRSKNPPAGENKKVTSKSLHLSLTMDPSNSEPDPLITTRKSFIREKMGDKDIVKRAFKTFQNNFSQLKSSAEERAIREKQVRHLVPAKGTDVKVSTSMTPRTENIVSLKSSRVDRKTAKLAPSSFVLKSDERAKRRKELSMKMEEKSNAKPAESTHLRTKSKEEKEEEIIKQRHSSNFKPTPMPGFYRAQKASKSPLDKAACSII
ncbi:protein WVD2-like 7 isoform X2 [Populus trichocarpa]|uniref:protein WVD2-like 7 isoform X2 n=1 Tax=Populus trichocarpa TaxID=3694 RepID=UPI002279412B|nr:protein WVD2-like 7 isoform X2 [Populus trichocarpa]